MKALKPFAAGMNVSHVLINNDVYQIVAARGRGSGHMGIAMTPAGLPEAIPMFIFPWMLKKKDSGFWFRLSGVFFTLKALYLMQLLQPMGWGLLSRFYQTACIMNEKTNQQDPFLSIQVFAVRSNDFLIPVE